MHRLATVHERDDQPTNQRPTNQRRHEKSIEICASFTKVKWGA